MRVLLLTHNCKALGGTYVRAVSLGAGLAAAGHDVTLVAGRRAPGSRPLAQRVDGVRVVEMPDLLPQRARHGGLSPVDITGRVALAAGERYDIVHGFDHRPAVDIPAQLQRARFGTPYVSDWCDLWGREGLAAERSRLARLTLGRLDAWGEERRLLKADGVTAISVELVRRALAAGVASGRVLYLPAGANVDRIHPLPADVARQRLGLKVDARYLVYVGFAHHDAPLLVPTLSWLHESGSPVHLITVGPGLEALGMRLRAAGLDPFYHPFGLRPYSELGPILAAGDVAVLPYAPTAINRARFPQRFGDYLAAGRPVVTNPTGDLAGIVAAEGIGAVAPADPAAFAAATRGLLDAADLRVEMGHRARMLAETRLSWRILAQRVGDLYANLLASSRAQPRRRHRRTGGIPDPSDSDRRAN